MIRTLCEVYDNHRIRVWDEETQIISSFGVCNKVVSSNGIPQTKDNIIMLHNIGGYRISI